MLKIKNILPVMAVVLFMGLSTTAFAQLSCGVASTPVSRATDTGLTEPAGDIFVNCLAPAGASATATSTITIDYGGGGTSNFITNTVGFPALNAGCLPAATPGVCNGGPIRISSTNVGTGGWPGGIPTIQAVDNVGGKVLIAIPAQPAPAATNSFTLSGVLLSLSGNGKSGCTTDCISANLSVTQGTNIGITAQQNKATVISAELPGITALALSAGTVAGTVLTNGVSVTPGFSVRVSETGNDVFRSMSQFNQGASTQGVQLLFTFTGIPTGVTLGSTGTPCTAAIAAAGAVATGGVTIVSANNTLTSTANTLTVEIVGPATGAGSPALTAIDTVTVACASFNLGATATVPLAAGQVKATVTLAPTGTAFGAANAVLTGATTPAGLVPRHTANQLPSPELVILNIIPATTHMLFPFVSIGNGFDTGFAIANTTADPYGFGATTGGARAQSGSVAMFFYPQTGSAFCAVTGGTASLPAGGAACTAFTTTAVGGGLSSGGVIASGASWVVLGSEIFKQIATAPAVFNGYAFGVANFTNAHATVFVADAQFSGKFTAGGSALVLPNPAIAARIPAVATGVVETLGH